MPKKNDQQSFFQAVYEIVRLIPKGRVTTYGAIATCLGSKGSSRMVGWAMNASHSIIPSVPAQRVVNRKGFLTGKHHFGNPKLMQQLLESEGIEIKDDRVVGFERFFWDPMKELEPK